jgi:nucleoside-diphosphate-sugar epimerase
MRISNTGGDGFTGFHPVDQLSQKGPSVRAFDNLRGQIRGPNTGAPADLDAGVAFARGGVRDVDALGQALTGVDAVTGLVAGVGFRDAGELTA